MVSCLSKENKQKTTAQQRMARLRFRDRVRRHPERAWIAASTPWGEKESIEMVEASDQDNLPLKVF